MDRREWFRNAILALGAAVLAAFLARWGIQLPPLPPPPAGPQAPQPPIVAPPQPPSPPEPAPDPFAAIHRIQFGNAGCTATVIGPRRADGKWWVLTAAHCVQRVGDSGTMFFDDGSRLKIAVVAINRQADCCWCITEQPANNLKYALLATEVPAAGSPIWHQGYGVDKPGNLERGEFVSGPDGNGQVKMELSVSSGDSGGGICLDGFGYVVSCVCCTDNRGRLANVWGAGPAAIRALQRTPTADEGWTPIEIPLRLPPSP